MKLKQRKSPLWWRFGYLVLITILLWWFCFSVYSLVFVLIKKICQILETEFPPLSKHLKFCQKYSAACRIFNSLLGVWISQWNTVSGVYSQTGCSFDGNFANFRCNIGIWLTVWVEQVAIHASKLLLLSCCFQISFEEQFVNWNSYCGLWCLT